MSISQTVIAGVLAVGVVGGVVAPKVIFPADVVELTPVCTDVTMRPGEVAGQAAVVITLVCADAPTEVLVPTAAPFLPEHTPSG